MLVNVYTYYIIVFLDFILLVVLVSDVLHPDGATMSLVQSH